MNCLCNARVATGTADSEKPSQASHKTSQCLFGRSNCTGGPSTMIMRLGLGVGLACAMATLSQLSGRPPAGSETLAGMNNPSHMTWSRLLLVSAPTHLHGRPIAQVEVVETGQLHANSNYQTSRCGIMTVILRQFWVLERSAVPTSNMQLCKHRELHETAKGCLMSCGLVLAAELVFHPRMQAPTLEPACVRIPASKTPHGITSVAHRTAGCHQPLSALSAEKDCDEKA